MRVNAVDMAVTIIQKRIGMKNCINVKLQRKNKHLRSVYWW